ncbi:YopX family protein [Acidaminococcus sp.]|uniref:YopX family protein n=1 Tax=Acidaminococcus sp. TaxID=1872103 RepID=UPI003D7C7A17
MREIRFRGWSYGKKDWVYGDLIQDGNTTKIVERTSHWDWPVDPQSVGQYTGFSTKTAGDIYEGDYIVVDDEELFLVVWDEDAGQWGVVAPDDYAIGDTLENEVATAEIVVVGTEYEDEHLGKAPWKEENEE